MSHKNTTAVNKKVSRDCNQHPTEKKPSDQKDASKMRQKVSVFVY